MYSVLRLSRPRGEVQVRSSHLPILCLPKREPGANLTSSLQPVRHHSPSPQTPFRLFIGLYTDHGVFQATTEAPKQQRDWGFSYHPRSAGLAYSLVPVERTIGLSKLTGVSCTSSLHFSWAAARSRHRAESFSTFRPSSFRCEQSYFRRRQSERGSSRTSS